MAQRRATVIYRGRVQGVGFRYTTRRAAARFAVTGTVKNLVNGSVELVAEGDEAEVRAFLAAVDEEHARNIREREIAWSDATGGLGDTFRVAF